MPIGFSGPYGCTNCGTLVYPGTGRNGYNSRHELLCRTCYQIDQNPPEDEQ